MIIVFVAIILNYVMRGEKKALKNRNGPEAGTRMDCVDIALRVYLINKTLSMSNIPSQHHNHCELTDQQALPS